MKRPNQGNVRYFQNCDTHLKAYFLGFIAADGCLLNNGKNSISLSITLSEVDRNLLNKLKEEIGCEHRIYDIRGKMTYNILKEKCELGELEELKIQYNLDVERNKEFNIKELVANYKTSNDIDDHLVLLKKKLYIL